MRTREEQIEEIKERVEDLSLVNCYPEFSEIQDWLIEAERRAEQRVRCGEFMRITRHFTVSYSSEKVENDND